MNDPREALALLAARLYQRGWMRGTAGNLSVRLDDGSLWITASGQPKGELSVHDFVRVAERGEVLERGAPEAVPSAETHLHRTLYRLFPRTRACLHVHSIEANLASRQCEGASLRLPSLEMLKGLGIADEAPEVDLAVFENHADVSRIAAEIHDRFSREPPRVPALLVRGHGTTAWGETLERALSHLEQIEFLLDYWVRARAGERP